MAKQRLGEKKHKLCEEIAGIKFIACYTRGGWKHGVAECWKDERTAYYVNYLVKHSWSKITDGQLVKDKI